MKPKKNEQASMQIANFFWHGSPLNLYVYACLASFVKHDFQVRLWCYRPLDAPLGVILCDASEILPESFIDKCEMAGKKPSMACFSDFFRYKLLSEKDGWWFDTDVLCLKNASEFAAMDGMTLGYEDRLSIAIGVMRLDKDLSLLLFNFSKSIGEKKNFNFDWGDVGPKLITDFITSNGIKNINIKESNLFYPIHYTDALMALSVACAQRTSFLCNDSLTYHYWNEILTRKNIDLDVMPPINSYLYNEFIAVCPDLKEKLSFSPRKINYLRAIYLTEEISFFNLLGVTLGRALIRLKSYF